MQSPSTQRWSRLFAIEGDLFAGKKIENRVIFNHLSFPQPLFDISQSENVDSDVMI